MESENVEFTIGDAPAPLAIGDGAYAPPLVGVHFDCQGRSRAEMVQELVEIAGKISGDPSKPLVEISWPCGGYAVYHTAGDVPLVDVPCQCGNPDHWLIKWEGGDDDKGTN